MQNLLQIIHSPRHSLFHEHICFQCSLSLPPENNTEPLAWWYFQGIQSRATGKNGLSKINHFYYFLFLFYYFLFFWKKIWIVLNNKKFLKNKTKNSLLLERWNTNARKMVLVPFLWTDNCLIYQASILPLTIVILSRTKVGKRNVINL